MAHTLSVITVTYNARHTLPRTMRSVQEQTYPHIEHIIVDGASADGTVARIEALANAGTRWISRPDNGLYDAMNTGAGLATGDYLCFLNAGDTFFDSTTVERLMRFARERHFPDILYGETAIVDGEGTFLRMRRHKTPKTLSWKSFRQGMMVCHQAFIVKRALFAPYDLRYRFSSDFDWCVRMMKRAETIADTRMTLINYLHEGMTTANRRASLCERYSIMSKYYGAVPTFFRHLWFVARALTRRQEGR